MLTRGRTPATPAAPRLSPRVRTAPPRRISTSRHITRFAVDSRTDRSVAWDTTFRIVFGLLITGAGNAVGGFSADTTGTAGLALYLLVTVSVSVYGMFYVVIGARMVVEITTEHTLEATKPTVGVSNGDDGDKGHDPGGDRGDGTGPPAHG